MADRGGEFSFFHVKIDISISVKPITNKFGKQVHLEKLTQIRLVKHELMTSSRQDKT